MSEKEKRPPEFAPVTERKEAISLLKEAAKTLAPVTIWAKDQELTLRSHVSHYGASESLLYVQIPSETEPRKFSQDLKKRGLVELYFSVSLARANIFFKADFYDFDPAGFRFSLPEKVFKVQRRNEFRHQIPDGYLLRVEFSDPLFAEQRASKKVIDISAGGLAFEVEEVEGPIYHPDLEIRDLNLTINGKRLSLNAKIKHNKAIPKGGRYKGVKVGVAFEKMREADSQLIATYVFEESRKYLTRFL